MLITSDLHLTNLISPRKYNYSAIFNSLDRKVFLFRYSQLKLPRQSKSVSSTALTEEVINTDTLSEIVSVDCLLGNRAPASGSRVKPGNPQQKSSISLVKSVLVQSIDEVKGFGEGILSRFTWLDEV